MVSRSSFSSSSSKESGIDKSSSSLPESFKVLIKELQALCLDIKVLDRDRNVIEIPELDPEDMAPPSKNNAPEQDKQESLTTLLPEDEDADAISNDFPDNDFPLNDLDSSAACPSRAPRFAASAWVISNLLRP